uniref:Uncharacterized protein n=1 Tax=Glossina pallidipes TaxID=7398 RepID=A0A1B0AK86_GLOPL
MACTELKPIPLIEYSLANAHLPDPLANFKGFLNSRSKQKSFKSQFSAFPYNWVQDVNRINCDNVSQYSKAEDQSEGLQGFMAPRGFSSPDLHGMFDCNFAAKNLTHTT